jgi:hypothetical protein
MLLARAVLKILAFIAEKSLTVTSDVGWGLNRFARIPFAQLWSLPGDCASPSRPPSCFHEHSVLACASCRHLS